MGPGSDEASNSQSGSKVRVLVLASKLGGGGAEKQAVCVANHLPRSSFQVTAGALRPEGSYETDLDPSVRYRELGHRTNSSTWAMVKAIPGIRRALREEQPEVVCSFTEPAIIAVEIAKRFEKVDPRTVAGVQIAVSEWRQALGKRYQPIFAAAEWAYKQADYVIALSEGVRSDLIQKGLHPERIETVHNGVIDDMFHARLVAGEVVAPRRRPYVIVACGRLVPQKAYPVLLEGFRRVRQDLDAELWIVGEGPERGALEGQCRRLGIGEDVHFFGFQANPLPTMAAADVFVLSSHYEGFANVIVEAMGAGVPVVSSDCPFGPKEILGESEHGLLFDRGDPEGLASKVGALLGDEELRERMVARGRRRAQAFTSAASGSNYGRILARL